MGRHEGNSAGAHFKAPEQPDPRRFRDASQTPKIGFGDRHHYFQGPRSAPKAFHLTAGSLWRGGDSMPRSSRTRRPRYARRDRHDPSHRSRPPVGAPCGALYSGSDTGALARGAQPRGTSARRSHAFAARGAGVSFGSTAWPNVSRPRERLRRRGVKIPPEPNFGVEGIMSIPERAFSAFGCRRASDGGAPFWSHGSLLSGSRPRATAGGRRHRFFRGRHGSRGRRAAIVREHRNERPRHGDDTETPRTPARPHADAPRRAAEVGGRGAAASVGTTHAAGTEPNRPLHCPRR
jgi:hypothetical protein